MFGWHQQKLGPESHRKKLLETVNPNCQSPNVLDRELGETEKQTKTEAQNKQARFQRNHFNIYIFFPDRSHRLSISPTSPTPTSPPAKQEPYQDPSILNVSPWLSRTGQMCLLAFLSFTQQQIERKKEIIKSYTFFHNKSNKS